MCIISGSRTQAYDGVCCLPNQIVSHSDVLLMLRALVYAAVKTVGLLDIRCQNVRMKRHKVNAELVCMHVVYSLMGCGDKCHIGMRVPPV